MDNINFYHLKYFVDAAKEGGVTQSARKNYVSQSAVSRAITSLEQNLGVDLVVHRKNHFQLTEAGEAILDKVQAIFETVAHLKEAATDHVTTLRGPLRFGCNQAIASCLVAPALPFIEARYPEIKPEIKLGNTDQIQQMLERQEIDFGIVVDDGEVENNFRTQKIYTNNLIVVKSPKFKMNAPFKNLIVSRTHRGGLSQKYFVEHEKVYGTPPSPKIVISSWQVIMDLAIAGYGAALIPKFICAEAMALKKLVEVKNKVGPISFDLCTIVRRNRILPKNARALLEYFESTTKRAF